MRGLLQTLDKVQLSTMNCTLPNEMENLGITGVGLNEIKVVS